MNSTKVILTLGIFTILLSLCPVSSHAQTCGPPPERVPNSLSDGTEMLMQADLGVIRSISMNSIKLFGDGYSMLVQIDPSGTMPVYMSINNSEDDPYDWGLGVLEVTTGHSIRPMTEPVDLTALPEEYAMLWNTLMSVAGDLADNELFWEKAGIEEGEIREKAQEDFYKLQDGYYVPDVLEQLTSITYTIGYGYAVADTLLRGYCLGAFPGLTVETPSAPGDQVPIIYLRIMGKMPQDRWNLSIFPGEGRCEIKCDGGNSDEPLSEEVWMPVFEKFREDVRFYYSQVPVLEAGGVIEKDSELELLLEKSLEGMLRYPIEVTYPERVIPTEVPTP